MERAHAIFQVMNLSSSSLSIINKWSRFRFLVIIKVIEEKYIFLGG